MVEGVVGGDIDVIVSSHDPKDADVKRRPFTEASDGAVGLETLLSASLRLFHGSAIDLVALLRPLTSRPAEILGLQAGRLQRGAPADLIIVDLHSPWIVNPDLLRSKCRNTPFNQSKMQGRVVQTLVGGKIVHDQTELAPV